MNKLFRQTNKSGIYHSISTNLFSLILILLVWVALALGCSNTSNAVERGRLKFVKSGNSPYFSVNGKKWSPKGENGFAGKMNWCDTSPNPNVEILRCFGDSTEKYQSTYILRMKGDEVEMQTLDEGVGSVWTNDEGRWLLFRKFFLNVETGERIEVKGMPFADQPDSSSPVIYVLGVSPDMKTVVARLDSVPKMEGDERFQILRIIDTETGTFENRKVSYSRNQWLNDHQNPNNNFQPPPSPSKKMVWEKGTDGKDKLVVPILLEKVEK